MDTTELTNGYLKFRIFSETCCLENILIMNDWSYIARI